jgi:hypothetical protein
LNFLTSRENRKKLQKRLKFTSVIGFSMSQTTGRVATNSQNSTIRQQTMLSSTSTNSAEFNLKDALFLIDGKLEHPHLSE